MPKGKVQEFSYDEVKQEYTLLLLEDHKSKKNKPLKSIIPAKYISLETRQAVEECRDTNQSIERTQEHGQPRIIAKPQRLIQIDGKDWSIFGTKKIIGKPVSPQNKGSYVCVQEYDDGKTPGSVLTFYAAQFSKQSIDAFEEAKKNKNFVKMEAIGNTGYHLRIATDHTIQLESADKNVRLRLTESPSNDALSLGDFQKSTETGSAHYVVIRPNGGFDLQVLPKQDLDRLQVLEGVPPSSQPTGKQFAGGKFSRFAWSVFDKTGTIPQMVDEAKKTNQQFKMGISDKKISCLPLEHRVLMAQKGASWTKINVISASITLEEAGDLAESHGLYEIKGDNTAAAGTLYIPRHIRESEDFKKISEKAKREKSDLLYDWKYDEAPKYSLLHRDKALKFTTERNAEEVYLSHMLRYFTDKQFQDLKKLPIGKKMILSAKEMKNPEDIAAASKDPIYGAMKAIWQEAQETEQSCSVKRSTESLLELEELQPRIKKMPKGTWEDFPGEALSEGWAVPQKGTRSDEPFDNKGIFKLRPDASSKGMVEYYLPKNQRDKADQFREAWSNSIREERLFSFTIEAGVPKAELPLCFKTERDAKSIDYAQVRDLLAKEDHVRLTSLQQGEAISLSMPSLESKNDLTTASSDPTVANFEAMRREAMETGQSLSVKLLPGGVLEVPELRPRIRKLGTDQWQDALSGEGHPVTRDGAKSDSPFDENGIFELRPSASSDETMKYYFPQRQRAKARDFREKWKAGLSQDRPLAFAIEGDALKATLPLRIQTKRHENRLEFSEVAGSFSKEDRGRLEAMSQGETIALSMVSLKRKNDLAAPSSDPMVADFEAMRHEARETEQTISMKLLPDGILEIPELRPRLRKSGTDQWQDALSGAGHPVARDGAKNDSPFDEKGIFKLRSIASRDESTEYYFPQTQRAMARDFGEKWKASLNQDRPLAFTLEGGVPKATLPLRIQINRHEKRLEFSEVEGSLCKEDRGRVEAMSQGETITLSTASLEVKNDLTTTSGDPIAADFEAMRREAMETGQRLSVKLLADGILEVPELRPRTRKAGTNQWQDTLSGSGWPVAREGAKNAPPFDENGVFRLRSSASSEETTEYYFPQTQRALAADFEEIWKASLSKGRPLSFDIKGDAPKANLSLRLKTERNSATTDIARMRDIFTEQGYAQLDAMSQGEAIALSPSVIRYQQNLKKDPHIAALMEMKSEAKETRQSISVYHSPEGVVEFQELRSCMRKSSSKDWTFFQGTPSGKGWPVPQIGEKRYQPFDENGIFRLRDNASDGETTQYYLNKQQRSVAESFAEKWGSSVRNKSRISFAFKDGTLRADSSLQFKLNGSSTAIDFSTVESMFPEKDKIRLMEMSQGDVLPIKPGSLLVSKYCGNDQEILKFREMLGEAAATDQTLSIKCSAEDFLESEALHPRVRQSPTHPWRDQQSGKGIPIPSEGKITDKLFDENGIFKLRDASSGKITEHYLPKHQRDVADQFRQQWEISASRYGIFAYSIENGVPQAKSPWHLKVDRNSNAVEFSRVREIFSAEDGARLDNVQKGKSVSILPQDIDCSKAVEADETIRAIQNTQREAKATGQDLSIRCPEDEVLEIQALRPRMREAGASHWQDKESGQGMPVPREGVGVDEPFDENGIFKLRDASSGEITEHYLPKHQRELAAQLRERWGTSLKNGRLFSFKIENGVPQANLPLHFRLEQDSESVDFSNVQGLFREEDRACLEAISKGTRVLLEPEHLQSAIDSATVSRGMLKNTIIEMSTEAKLTNQKLSFELSSEGFLELHDLHPRVQEPVKKQWVDFKNGMLLPLSDKENSKKITAGKGWIVARDDESRYEPFDEHGMLTLSVDYYKKKKIQYYFPKHQRDAAGKLGKDWEMFIKRGKEIELTIQKDAPSASVVPEKKWSEISDDESEREEELLSQRLSAHASEKRTESHSASSSASTQRKVSTDPGSRGSDDRRKIPFSENQGSWRSGRG